MSLALKGVFNSLYALLAAALSSAVVALPVTIDDSGTFTRSPTVQLKWSTPPSRHTKDTAVTGATAVQVRLNLTPWLGHAGRIYLVLPAQPPGPIRAVWTSQGRLLPGQVISGNRTLVYSGAISTPYLEDVLQLSITADGREMQQTYTLDFHFEMEIS
jgi:hypothetical protein